MTSKKFWVREASIKLITYLQNAMKGKLSGKAIKKIIEAGGVCLNGKVMTYATHLLKKGDELEFTSIEKTPPKKAKILFEDSFLLVVNKSAGSICSVDFAKKELASSASLVHRLDKDTTGVLILAKTEDVCKQLIEQFKNLSMHKEYLAIVCGMMAKASGSVGTKIAKTEQFSGKQLFKASEFLGKEARTDWKVISQANGVALLLCIPKTGRTHQIRVHMHSISHPILGDREYGGKTQKEEAVPRQMLHAYRITFEHPITKKILTITADIPEDFQQGIKRFGLSLSDGK